MEWIFSLGKLGLKAKHIKLPFNDLASLLGDHNIVVGNQWPSRFKVVICFMSQTG